MGITWTILKKLLKITKDLLISFPELKDELHKDIVAICLDNDDKSDAVNRIHEHIKLIYPQRFFDILYENADMFTNDEHNLEFLPGIDFKILWKEDISDKTRECIWKYLQLLLFTVAGKLSSNESFGDTAKLFEAIDENELKSKLEDTMNSLQDMFKHSMNDNDQEDEDDNENEEDDGKEGFTMPNPENN